MGALILMGAIPCIGRAGIGGWMSRLGRWAAVLALLVSLTGGCGGNESPPPGDSSAPDSFSFFDVGVNTVLTDSLRDRLRDQLGRAGVSQRNVLDLEPHYPGFLAEYLPGLHELHRRLNGTAGARVEHDTTRLDYRYMDRDQTPFDRVEMTFDNETGKPLLVRIHTRRDGEAVAAALREAHGPPRVIDWGEGIRQSRVWTRNGDVMVFSVTEAASGIPEYDIVIYYVNRLRDMVAREEARRESRQEKERDAIRRAF
jgi:hypothetical protein